jgi:hypothetical protein
MIPKKLANLIESQPGEIFRSDRATAVLALKELDIDPNSEIAEFFLTYQITLFRSESSFETLCDIDNDEISTGTNFIHEVWGLPDNYICLTTCEGEGCYLYDKNNGTVCDFDLGEREKFLNGKIKTQWPSFFDFLAWYLG